MVLLNASMINLPFCRTHMLSFRFVFLTSLVIVVVHGVGIDSSPCGCCEAHNGALSTCEGCPAGTTKLLLSSCGLTSIFPGAFSSPSLSDVQYIRLSNNALTNLTRAYSRASPSLITSTVVGPEDGVLPIRVPPRRRGASIQWLRARRLFHAGLGPSPH